MEKTVKLNLACGEDYREGYINVDDGSMFDSKRDITADIRTFSWEPNTVDEILVSHFLMYVRPFELYILLVTWHACLKDGGKLIIENPDIKKLAEILLNEKDLKKVYDFGMINLFGRENDPPHRWSYSPESVKNLLHTVGFKKFTITNGDKKPQRDFKITAIK